MNDLAKNVVLWIVIAVVLATVVSNFSSRGHAVQEMPYSAFLAHVKDGSVSQVTFSGDKISGLRSSGEQFVVYNPETDNSALIGTLQDSGVTFAPVCSDLDLAIFCMHSALASHFRPRPLP